MKNEIKWDIIQKYYDGGNMWKDVMVKFNISNSKLADGVKNGLFKTRSRSESIKISHKCNPRKLSEETKNKISESMIKYLRENPDKVPYKLNHYSKGESYPEKYFREILENTNLIYEKEYCVSSYRLDFAFIDKAINLEIDGEQHYVDKRIVKSNNRRDEYLNKLGWEIIRVRWTSFKKMNNENKEIYITSLLEYINGQTTTIKPMILSGKKKYYCECGNEITRKAKKCITCHKKNNRKVERPPYDQLIKEIEETNYSVVGRKYGVSSTTIKNWIKNYEKINK